MKDVLKYVMKKFGGQFVETVGVQMKMQLYVDNLDIRLKVRSTFYFIWEYDNLDMHDSV